MTFLAKPGVITRKENGVYQILYIYILGITYSLPFMVGTYISFWEPHVPSS